MAHHLQFGGDTEAQRQAQPVQVGVDVRVDQSGQERPPACVHDGGTRRDRPPDRSDARAIQYDRARPDDLLAIEDPGVGNGCDLH